MIRRVLVLAVSLAALAGAAAAEPVPPPQPTEPAPPLRPGEDAEDFRPPAEQVFISPAGEPFRATLDAAYPAAAWFTRADTDKDGVLTSAEFTADALAFHARLDTDHDGLVDGFENADYERDIAPEITGVMKRPPPRPQGGDGSPMPRVPSRSDRMWGRMPMLSPKPAAPRPAPRRQGAGQYGLLNEPHPVRGSDGDLDGKITRAEATAAAKRRFGLLDTDGDGRLTLQDLPKTPAQQMFEDLEPPARRKP